MNKKSRCSKPEFIETCRALVRQPTLSRVSGELTELQCLCGGLLRQEQLVMQPKLAEFPSNRRARVQKKQVKRWLKEAYELRKVFAVIGLMRHPSFKCESCSRPSGFYAAMGRNMFKVEPLHAGAATFYLGYADDADDAD